MYMGMQRTKNATTQRKETMGKDFPLNVGTNKTIARQCGTDVGLNTGRPVD